MSWCKQPWFLSVFCSILLGSSALFLRHHYAHLIRLEKPWSLLSDSRRQPSQPAPGQALARATERYRYQEAFTSTTYIHLAQNIDWHTTRQELTLARRDQIQQQETVIAGTATSDNIYIAWRDLRQDDGDIYAQRIDAKGNRLWTNDLRINTDTGTALQFEPAIATDAAGTLWVTWVDNRNGNNDIYAQRINSSGERLWREEVQVNSDGAAADQGGVSLALLPEQGAVLAWHDNRAGSYDIYVARLAHTGTPAWAENRRVNSDMTDSAQTYPALAANAAGDLTVVWLDQRIGNSDIYAHHLAASGQLLWQSEVRLNQPAEAAQSHPRLAIHPSGENWIVWAAAQSGHLLAQQISDSGQLAYTSAWPVSQPSEPLDPNQQPFLTVAADGTLVAAWVASADGNLYAQRFRRQGNLLWPQAVRLSRASAENTIERSAVALTAARKAFIMAAWTDNRTGNQGDVYSQALDQAGAHQWPQDQLINDQSGKVDQQLAAVTTLADGGQVVVWQDWRSGTAALYLQRLTSAGHLAWSTQLQATAVTTASGQLAAAVAAVGSDTMIVWSDNRNGVARLYSQRFDQNGNRQWPQDLPINHPLDRERAQLNPALTSDQQGRIFLVWEEISTLQRRLVLQQLGAQGVPLWHEPLTVPTGAAPRLPAIKAGKADSLYVAWLEKSADGANLFLQRVTAAGAFAWPTMIQGNRATDEVNTLNPPVLGVDDGGNVVVVWVGRQEGAIMAQRLTQAGALVWPADVKLNSMAGGFAPLPDLAVLPNGNAVVVWQQLFEKRYTIAAQSLDANGLALWQGSLTNQQEVIVSLQAVGAQRPKIAPDGQGNTVVVWQDRRFSNWDITAQQLSAAGELTWPFDTLLVPQEEFYVASGTVESTAIDQTAEPIMAALLRTTYQRHGGDVQFWLSNNGGAQWEAVKPGTLHSFGTSGSDLRWKATLQAHPHHFARAPVVQGITIEYALTKPVQSDLYEADDGCTLARPLQMNGVAQAHTLAAATNQSEEDWVTLTLGQQGQVSLIAQTPTPTAAIQLVLYTACDGPAIAAATSQADGVAALTVAGTAGSHFLVQIRSASATNPQTSSYSLAAYSTAETPLAVIVAGPASANQQVANQIQQVADRAYRTLRNHGYMTETIYFLNRTPEHDADGDGRNDVDATTSTAGLQYALEGWLPTAPKAEATSLLLFLVGLGNDGQFQITATERITAAQLNLWLTNAERANTLDQVVVMLEMNQAGRWITPGTTTTGDAPTLAGRNRIILAATDAQGAAWHTPTGILFADMVWTALDQGASLGESSERARALTEQIGYRCTALVTPCQQPWLDDTGDSQANQPNDGAFAQQWRLYPLAPATAPVIQSVTIQPADGQNAKTIDVALTRATSTTVVTAEIIPPAAVVPLPLDGLPPGNAFPVIRLQAVVATALGNPPANTTLYRGVYDGFSELGIYRIVIYAQSAGDVAAFPLVTTINTGVTLYLPLISHTPLQHTN